MAFDHPIEADRIDDFNLFSAFVRAPLWILGGVLGSKSNEGDEDLEGCDNSNISGSPLSSVANTPPKSGGSGDGSPYNVRVVSNDVLPSNNTSNHRGSTKANNDDNNDNANDIDKLHERFGECSVEWHSTASESKGLKRSKNLSWSDESGKSLVEFNDESVIHEPSPYHTATSMGAPKPKKPALKRSRSVRTSPADDCIGMFPSSATNEKSMNLHGTVEAGGPGTMTTGTAAAGGMLLSATNNEKPRYIPRMGHSEGGLIKPTRPYGGVSNAHGGVESPQWGWYINTTPPTPEMYYSKSKPNRSSPTPSQQASIQTQPSIDEAVCHNQVFQNLQNANRPMGWTSVPI